MPTRRRLTRKAWNAYIARLRRQRHKAREDAYEFLKGVENPDRKRIMARAVRTATHNGAAAAAIACTWYETVAKAAGVEVPRAKPVIDVNAAQIGAAYKRAERMLSLGDAQGFVDAIASGIEAEVKRCSSSTMRKNAERDGAEFAWVPQGDETCAFCMTVASNGWVRAKKSTAEGDHEDHIHPNCDCEFAIRFSRDDNVEGYDPGYYKEKYRNAPGMMSKDKINSLRRDLYAERKIEINKQRRERYAAQHQSDD